MKKTGIVLFTLAICSCGNIGKEMTDMQTIGTDIKQKYHFENVGTTINNGENLQVSLINTTYNDSSDKAKQDLADSIALICIRDFHAAKLVSGTVAFVKKSNLGMLNTSTSDSYSMNIHKLPAKQ